MSALNDRERDALDAHDQRRLTRDVASMAWTIEPHEVAALSDNGVDPWPFGGDDIARAKLPGDHKAHRGTLWQREADRERRLDRVIKGMAELAQIGEADALRRYLTYSRIMGKANA